MLKAEIQTNYVSLLTESLPEGVTISHFHLKRTSQDGRPQVAVASMSFDSSAASEAFAAWLEGMARTTSGVSVKVNGEYVQLGKDSILGAIRATGEQK